jgi:uncharacterized protein involved in exopolysaccharide biosynthesis
MQAAALGVNIPGQDSADSNFVEILNSRSIREALLNARFVYHQSKGRFGKSKEYSKTLMAYLAAPNLDKGVSLLGTIISASKDNKTRVLTISVETQSPDLSMQVAQKSMQLLESFVLTKSQTRGSVKARYAESRLADARAERTMAEERFMAFLAQNRNYPVSTDPATKIAGMRLESELKLRQQLEMMLATSKEQALLEEKNDMPILNVMDRANLPIEKSGPARVIIALKVFFFGTILLALYGFRTELWHYFVTSRQN